VDGFDLKVFCELRPGLIGWTVVNLGMCAKQLEVYGAISPEMFSVNVFQALYVADALYNERAILTTMDITTDGFGFMLAFGDLAWVPFTYSLQARYLTHNHPSLSHYQLGAIWCLNFCGYALFRLSNSQKDAFRRCVSAVHTVHWHLLVDSTSSGQSVWVACTYIARYLIASSVPCRLAVMSYRGMHSHLTCVCPCARVPLCPVPCAVRMMQS
jgi:hypothetical protein